MPRRYYRVTHIPIQRPCPPEDSNVPDMKPLEPIIVEGYANSAYHACKVAFKTMLAQGYIAYTPTFNQDLDGFPNTEVEIIPEPEHEPVE